MPRQMALSREQLSNPFESLDVKLTGALPYLVVNMTVDENSDFYDDEFRISGDDVDELGNRFYLSRFRKTNSQLHLTVKMTWKMASFIAAEGKDI